MEYCSNNNDSNSNNNNNNNIYVTKFLNTNITICCLLEVAGDFRKVIENNHSVTVIPRVVQWRRLEALRLCRRTRGA